MVGVGLAGLIGKLHKWDESAFFFDGSSLGALPTFIRRFSLRTCYCSLTRPLYSCYSWSQNWENCLSLAVAYVFGIAMYLSVTVQSLRTIVTPVEGVDTREDRLEAMRILAAGNSIIILLLGAILCLQVSGSLFPSVFGTFCHFFGVETGCAVLVCPDVLLGPLRAPTGLMDAFRICSQGCSLTDGATMAVYLCLYFQGGQEYARRQVAKELWKLERGGQRVVDEPDSATGSDKKDL